MKSFGYKMTCWWIKDRVPADDGLSNKLQSQVRFKSPTARLVFQKRPMLSISDLTESHRQRWNCSFCNAMISTFLSYQISRHFCLLS